MAYFDTLFAEDGDKTAIPLKDETGKVSWENGYGIKYAITEEINEGQEVVTRENINYIFNKLTELNNQLVTYDKALYQQQEVKNIGQIIYGDTTIKVVVSESEAIDLTRTKNSPTEQIESRELAEEIASSIGINGLIVLNDFGKDYFDYKIKPFNDNTPWVNVTTENVIVIKNNGRIFDTLKNTTIVKQKSDDLLVLLSFNDLFLKSSNTVGEYEKSNIPEHNHDFESSLDGEHTHSDYYRSIWRGRQSATLIESGYYEAQSSPQTISTPQPWDHNHIVTPLSPTDDSGIGEHTRPKNVAFFARMFLVEEDEHGSTVPAIEKIIKAL